MILLKVDPVFFVGHDASSDDRIRKVCDTDFLKVSCRFGDDH